MTRLNLQLDDRSAQGLVDAITKAIRDNRIEPGQRLPPIRTMAKQTQLSPATVQSAWGILTRGGIIHTHGRNGTIVSDTGRHLAAADAMPVSRQTFEQDLSTGWPDPELLPTPCFAKLDLLHVRASDAHLTSPILPALVEVLRKTWPCEAEAFMMADGAMDATALITRTFLRPGDRVLVEDPAFPVLASGLRAMGVDMVGLPVDREGVSAEALEAALQQPAVAIYLQPRAHNPTGASLSDRRIADLAKLLKPTSTLIVEDDSMGMVASSAARSLGALLPERTLHIRSFSKSHGPDLRLAAVSGPSHLIRRLHHGRQFGQGWSSQILQYTLLNLLTDANAIEQVRRARDSYRQRREAMVKALARHGLAIHADDGFNLWVPVANQTEALVRLACHGIGAMPGDLFTLTRRERPAIRLTISRVRDGHDELATHIAAAARAMPHFTGR